MKYWLMKSEPDVFSFEDLVRDKQTWWEGVRNYQARNFMTTDMNIDDLVLFYHSNANPPGIAGLAKVSAKAIADKTQFEKKSEYYDKKATLEKPIWFCVQVKPVKIFKNFLSLQELKDSAELQNLLVIKKGQRLSIQPVAEKDFKTICKMGGVSI